MPRSRRIIKKPTPERLANAALYYLSRYAASEGSLRRVLENRVRRAALADAAFAGDAQAQAALAAAIDKIVEGHKQSGVLNDAAYAEMKVGSLRRSGKSSRRIVQHLAHKGVKAELIAAALMPEDSEDDAEQEVEAARTFAKKRGFGPFRKGGATQDVKLRAKEIAALARAGFSFDVAKEVLGAGPDDCETQEEAGA